MKAFLLFSVLLTRSLIGSNENTFLHVNLHSYNCGMFSVFNYVLGVLHEYETNGYGGLEIDFENLGLYYDESRGKNWWTYYLDPVSIGTKHGKEIKKFDIEEYTRYSFHSEFNSSSKQANSLIRKYFKIRESIQQKVDRFATAYLSYPYIISVHYRGTDKSAEAPPVSYAKMVEIIQGYIQMNHLKEYVFLPPVMIIGLSNTCTNLFQIR